MKWIRIAFIITSIILLFIIIYAIANCEVSYKYEIEGRHESKVNILWVGEWIKETINVWKYFLCYVIINIAYLSISIISFYRQKHRHITKSK